MNLEDREERQLKIALVGRKAVGKTFVAFYLQRHHGFKRMRMDDGVSKFMRDMYGYNNYERPKWERRYDIYDALFKVDPFIHVGYLFSRMQRITKDIVIEDVRYISELKELRARGFIIIRVGMPERQRRRHIAKSLRNAEKGSLLLAEHFYDDRTAEYSADYSIINEEREKTKKIVSELLDTIRTDVL